MTTAQKARLLDLLSSEDLNAVQQGIALLEATGLKSREARRLRRAAANAWAQRSHQAQQHVLWAETIPDTLCAMGHASIAYDGAVRAVYLLTGKSLAEWNRGRAV
jgi:hypothetical protein